MVSTVTMNAGRPVSAAIDSMNSVVRARSGGHHEDAAVKNFQLSYQFLATLRRAAIVEGIGRPPQPLWLGENEDAKPAAPARSASRTTSFIRFNSSGTRHLASRSFLAHHRGADRRMLREHADVRIGTMRSSASRYSREGLELPARAREQGVRGPCLRPPRGCADGFALRRRARRDAEAAVAQDRGGNAERDRGERVGSQVICAS